MDSKQNGIDFQHPHFRNLGLLARPGRLHVPPTHCTWPLLCGLWYYDFRVG